MVLKYEIIKPIAKKAAEKQPIAVPIAPLGKVGRPLRSEKKLTAEYLKPWDALEISRRTWYLWRKKGIL